MRGGVYLDYAATSAIRPPEVVDAVARFLTEVGASPGRAAHGRALEAGRVALRCRRALAELFGVPGDPGRIAFQLNATHALNVAVQGVLRPGEAVVRTRYDHNAVRRPIAAMRARGVEERMLAGRPDGGVDLDELRQLLRAGPARVRLLVLPHASNVLGSALPVRAMADLAHDAGALVLVDAAQSAGHLPLDVEAMGIDLLAFTGHKGLLGPQGVGGLWVREGVEVEPILHGGTGGDSAADRMPDSLPDRLEAGTQNGPAMAGLLAGLDWIRSNGGVEAMHARERGLKARLLHGLNMIPRLRVRSPAAPDGVGIVTLTVEGVAASEVALALERDHGVLVRAGLHCSPDAHETIGTATGGAVRLSVGWATTEADVDRAIEALGSLAQNR